MRFREAVLESQAKCAFAQLSARDLIPDRFLQPSLFRLDRVPVDGYKQVRWLTCRLFDDLHPYVGGQSQVDGHQAVPAVALFQIELS